MFNIRNVPGGARRVAALKTGTTNDLKDYSTYGFLAQPKNKKQPALAVGVWFGNSDSSSPTVPSYRPIYSSDNAGPAWRGFVRDYMRGKPNAEFKRPSRVVSAQIDSFSGGAPGPWTRARTTELFVKGTQPGGKRQVDPAGLIYSKGCGTYLVQPARAENPGAPASWLAAVNAWASKGGLGTSRWGTRGTYFTLAHKTSFGGPVAPGTGCSAPRSTSPRTGGSKSGSGSGGGGGNNPAPTCTPGSTTKPEGCTIPAPE
jgi:membrane peptidoglycan carboxypeptidase